MFHSVGPFMVSMVLANTLVGVSCISLESLSKRAYKQNVFFILKQLEGVAC